MSRKKKNEILESVVIEQIAAEGNSIARLDGKVLFVPQGIPGDVVDVLVTRKKSGFMEGRILRMVSPSPDRKEPFCDHYGVCGGCKWQPLPYELQLQFKQQQVVDQLTRIGKLELPPVLSILGSEKTIDYRNKLEYTFSDRRWLFDGEDPDEFFSPPIALDPADYPNGFPHSLRKGFSSLNSNTAGFGVGFHIAGFFDKVLDISKCYLQEDTSNQIRNWIRDYAISHNISFFNLREQNGILRTLIIRNNVRGDYMVTLAISLKDKDIYKLDKILTMLNLLVDKFPCIKSLYYVNNTKANDTIGDLDLVLFSGEDAIYEEMEGLKFKIGPKSFYQTNSEQAYRLYSEVRKFADLDANDVVYDLYTGTGTIALFVAREVKKVYGIEYVPEAIKDAKLNAVNNSINNCEFFAGDMKDILTSEFVASTGRPDVIILDPPRAGIHPDVAQVILEASPSKMVYVSCNPATQARDLAIFSSDYEVTAVRPVDMFPHTHHVENVVGLKRRNITK